MAKYENKQFLDQSIVIDGNEYMNCSFTRCQIIFTGGALPLMNGNSFHACKWDFDGPAARTIQFMTALYGGGGRTLIENTFKNIRGKPANGMGLH